MNGFAAHGNGFDLPELWRLLEELEEGTLEPPQGDELAALLDRSPAARRAYLEYFQQSAVLRMEAAKLYERGLLPVAGSAVETRRAFQRSLLAAAALVVLLGVIAALLKISLPQVPVVSSAAVAGTKWSVDGQPRESAEEALSLRPGSTLRVDSGSVRLKQDSGSTLVIQGPAEVSFPDLQRPELRRGWLWIDSVEGDEGFAVDTPDFTVRDIGTRFGVRVPQDGPLEVHLIEGRVQIQSKASRGVVVELSTPATAKAFASDGKRLSVPLAADPFPGLSALLGEGTGYRLTLLGQSPAGYWTLDDPLDGELGNEVVGGSCGFCGVAVRQGMPGVGGRGALAGFPAGNHALYLDGSPNKSVVAGIDGPGGVRRREGAVSFWIRRAPEGKRRDEILWLAGSSSSDDDLPERAMMHSRLRRSGHVEFVITSGGGDLTLASNQGVADGQWHHVAASWGPSSVELYIDGVRSGAATRIRQLEEGRSDGRYVRFGKPSRELMARFDAFTGWVDEIALWNRPLDGLEVARQFEAAKGMVDGR